MKKPSEERGGGRPASHTTVPACGSTAGHLVTNVDGEWTHWVLVSANTSDGGKRRGSCRACKAVVITDQGTSGGEEVGET